MPLWVDFYWGIVALLCLQLVLQFFALFRLLPRLPARIMDLTLKGVGLVIGILLLLKAPNYVSSQFPKIAEQANLLLLVCILVAVTINLWSTARLLLSLLRERNAFSPLTNSSWPG